jgi:hypothetical protein
MARLPRSKRTSPLMFSFNSFSSSAACGKLSTGLAWELSGRGVTVCMGLPSGGIRNDYRTCIIAILSLAGGGEPIAPQRFHMLSKNPLNEGPQPNKLREKSGYRVGPDSTDCGKTHCWEGPGYLAAASISPDINRASSMAFRGCVRTTLSELSPGGTAEGYPGHGPGLAAPNRL